MKTKEAFAENGRMLPQVPDSPYGLEGDPSASYPIVPSRRLEDRIRELCEKVLTATESELDSTLTALQVALHEHTERFRKLAADQIVGHTGHEEKRRSSP